MTTLRSISPMDVHKALTDNPGALLIDVRTPAEFGSVHATGTVNLPLERVSADALRALHNGRTGGLVYVFCRTGARAKMACDRLANQGVNDVLLVEGGTVAWEQAGLPVERGRETMSLERQVRITAGSLVLVGSLLAVFVHSWFWALPVFVGGGLVFSGVTDTCGMGMLLARLPWNQRA